METKNKKFSWGFMFLGLLFATWVYFAYLAIDENFNFWSVLFLLVMLFLTIGFFSQGWLFNKTNIYLIKPFIKFISKIFWKSPIGVFIENNKQKNKMEIESGKYKIDDIKMSVSGAVIVFIISIIFIIIIYPKWRNDEIIYWYEYIGAGLWMLLLLPFSDEKGPSVTKTQYNLAIISNFILKSVKWISIAILVGVIISWFFGLPPTTIIIILLVLLLLKNSYK